MKLIAEAIENRIKSHIEEHKGLYSEDELKILKPVWRAQIKLDALKAFKAVTA